MTAMTDLRKTYIDRPLDKYTVDTDPFPQFRQWMTEALRVQLPEPYAMTLATADLQGRPSARIVLLKGVDEVGFTFFTNYKSLKGQVLAVNPQACLLFHWVELERQVRITGRVEKLSAQQSDEYYDSRPLASRIGAWASEQSQVIENRDILIARVKQFSLQFGNQPMRPPHWGGYRLVPDYLEFWQGRPSRLHDRICYLREENDRWRISQIAP